jgi:hypothetical protein
VYGATASPENVKVCIKNLLARQHIPQMDHEEIVDTDKDEDF